MAVAVVLVGTVVYWERADSLAPDIVDAVRPEPSPQLSLTDIDDAVCNAATVIPGEPAGNLGGMEGWFNSTPSGPCDEWPEMTLNHPDTVLISTVDNTMVEAYYRTGIEPLGVYGQLEGDFAVPDPDPSWPADSLVLIDARTGETLLVTAIEDLRAPPDPPDR